MLKAIGLYVTMFSFDVRLIQSNGNGINQSLHVGTIKSMAYAERAAILHCYFTQPMGWSLKDDERYRNILTKFGLVFHDQSR